MTSLPSPATFDPSSSSDYRALLGRVPTSVVVISSMDEQGPAGLSIGSFTSVSIDPPLVGFFIGRSSTTWPRIAATGRFCASVLGRSQETVSRLFATRGADKFDQCGWERTPAGLPLITGCTAWFDCVIDKTVDSGDHDLVLGRIEAMGSGVDEPLVFLGGGYGAVDLDGSMH